VAFRTRARRIGRLLSVVCTLLEQQTLFDPTYEVGDAAA